MGESESSFSQVKPSQTSSNLGMQLITNIGLLATLQAVLAYPQDPQDSCPKLHVIAARGTNVKPGYDLLITLVNNIKSKYAGATSEALDYPACGGQSSCGGYSYKESVNKGTDAVAKAVNEFYEKCPETELVLLGYSQVIRGGSPRREYPLIWAVS